MTVTEEKDGTPSLSSGKLIRRDTPGKRVIAEDLSTLATPTQGSPGRSNSPKDDYHLLCKASSMTSGELKDLTQSIHSDNKLGYRKKPKANTGAMEGNDRRRETPESAFIVSLTDEAKGGPRKDSSRDKSRLCT
ncbi:hypothetical protein C922_05537 [Plasmodium inui San Antonio 1]|uniref:Uncharacterized protein n=1 Tax=Plasmodium inui San Antonio 1 TaxID=1237626 RepID=W6ZT53_9APIC|nr:hypothetical protein C922_05537 [Plasmodium inui San Antonio 1]EUD64082.1 hypothetical protein C922_05537 [Plasmodium inui San Antonio 1]